MFTKFKGKCPTDEELWEQMPQEMKEKIMSQYVENYHKKGGKK